MAAEKYAQKLTIKINKKKTSNEIWLVKRI